MATQVQDTKILGSRKCLFWELQSPQIPEVEGSKLDWNFFENLRIILEVLKLPVSTVASSVPAGAFSSIKINVFISNNY
jgi:hypothetical protein